MGAKGTGTGVERFGEQSVRAVGDRRGVPAVHPSVVGGSGRADHLAGVAVGAAKDPELQQSSMTTPTPSPTLAIVATSVWTEHGEDIQVGNLHPVERLELAVGVGTTEPIPVAVEECGQFLTALTGVPLGHAVPFQLDDR